VPMKSSATAFFRAGRDRETVHHPFQRAAHIDSIDRPSGRSRSTMWQQFTLGRHQFRPWALSARTSKVLPEVGDADNHFWLLQQNCQGLCHVNV